jgi:chemotaxis protein MotB
MRRFPTQISVRSGCGLTPALVTSLALSACGVDDQVHQAALRDLEEQRQLASQRGMDLDNRGAEVQGLKHRNAVLEDDHRKAAAALELAKKSMEEMARASAQAEARAAQFRDLVAQFRKMTESGKLKVEIRDNRMIVSLGDRILFDPGRAELKRDGAETLKQVTTVLRAVGARDFQVAGHTDNAPIRSTRYRSNWDLSSSRAVEVVNFMIANGMEPKRLSAAGYADQDPVASNETAEGKAKNRRIEITLMPNIEDLPPIVAETSAGGGPPGDQTPPPGAHGKRTASPAIQPAGDIASPMKQPMMPTEKDKDGTAAMPKSVPAEHTAPMQNASTVPSPSLLPAATAPKATPSSAVPNP